MADDRTLDVCIFCKQSYKGKYSKHAENCPEKKSKVFFEKKTYTLTVGQDEAVSLLAAKYPRDFDNKSHVVRCAIIAFLREQRKKGKFISEVL